jgi:AhpC/TSA family
MPYLAAAVGLVGALCVLDLLLTLAVIRRLRELSARLTALEAYGPARGPSWLPVGSNIPEFSAITMDGEAISHRDLASGWAVIAFLHSGCEPCRRLVPELKAYIDGASTEGLRALAVVSGEEEAAPGGLASELREVAAVVRGADAAAVVRAFDVRSFPTLYAVEGGAIQAAGTHVRQLPAAG